MEVKQCRKLASGHCNLLITFFHQEKLLKLPNQKVGLKISQTHPVFIKIFLNTFHAKITKVYYKENTRHVKIKS